MLNLEEPKLFNSVLQEFLDDVEAGKGWCGVDALKHAFSPRAGPGVGRPGKQGATSNWLPVPGPGEIDAGRVFQNLVTACPKNAGVRTNSGILVALGIFACDCLILSIKWEYN